MALLYIVALLTVAQGQDWSKYVCANEKYDDHCVKCLYNGGDFYSNDGVIGRCIEGKKEMNYTYKYIADTTNACRKNQTEGIPYRKKCWELENRPLEQDETYITHCASQ